MTKTHITAGQMAILDRLPATQTDLFAEGFGAKGTLSRSMKMLVEEGIVAIGDAEYTGRRPRAVYVLTKKGKGIVDA